MVNCFLLSRDASAKSRADLHSGEEDAGMERKPRDGRDLILERSERPRWPSSVFTCGPAEPRGRPAL